MTTARREEPVPQEGEPKPRGGTSHNKVNSSQTPGPSRSHHANPNVVVDAKAATLPMLPLLLSLIKLLPTTLKRLLMFLVVVFMAVISSLILMVMLR